MTYAKTRSKDGEVRGYEMIIVSPNKMLVSEVSSKAQINVLETDTSSVHFTTLPNYFGTTRSFEVTLMSLFAQLARREKSRAGGN